MRPWLVVAFGLLVLLQAASALAEPMLVPLENEIKVGQKVYVPLLGGPKKGKVKWGSSKSLKLLSSSAKGAKFEAKEIGTGLVEASFNGQRAEATIQIRPLVDPQRDKSKKVKKDDSRKPDKQNQKAKSDTPDPKLKALLDNYRTRLINLNIEDKFKRQSESAEKNKPDVKGHEAALKSLSENFLKDLRAQGSSLKDLQRFRDRYMAASKDGDPLFPGEKGWDKEFLAVERALMFGRALVFDELLKETIRETLQKNPDACLIGQIDIGSWVNLDLAGLTFPGDIDASTVAVDPNLNVNTRNLFENKLVNRVGLNMVDADTVLTAHGQATGDVFIGHWGKAFAELDMLRRSSWKQIVPVVENGKVVDIKMVKRPGKDLFWEVALRGHEEAIKAGRERGPEVEFPKLDLAKEPMLSMEMLRHGIHDVEHGPYSRGQQVIKMLKYAERSYFMSQKAVAEYQWNPYQKNDPALARLATEVVKNKKNPDKVSQLISEFADTIPEFAGKAITPDNVLDVTKTIIDRAKTAMHDNAVRSLAFRLNKLGKIEDETTRSSELERLWTDLDTEIQEFRKSSGDAPAVMAQALDLVQQIRDGNLKPSVLEQRSQALHKLLNDSYKLSDDTVNRIMIFDGYRKLRVYLRQKLGWMPRQVDDFVAKARQKYPNGAKVYDAVQEFNNKVAESTEGSALIGAADWADNAFSVYDAYLSGDNQIDALKKSCAAIAEIALLEKFPGLQLPLAAYRSVSAGDPRPLAMAIGFKLFPGIGQLYMVSTVMERVDTLAHEASFYDELNTMLENTEFNAEGKIVAFKTKRHTEDVSPPGNRKAIVAIFTDYESPFYVSTAFRYWRNMVPTENDQFGLYEKKLAKLRRVFPTHDKLKQITLLLQTYRGEPLDQADKHYATRVRQLKQWEAQIAELVWVAMADSLEAAVVAVSQRSEWEKELERLESKLSAGDAYLGSKKGLRAKAAFEVSKHGSIFTGENQYVIAPIYKKFIANYQAIEKIRQAITYDLWVANFGVDIYVQDPPIKRYILLGSERSAPRLTGDPDVDLAVAKAAFKGHKNFAVRIKKDLSAALGRKLDIEKDESHIKALGQLGFEMEHLRDDCPERISASCTAETVGALKERFARYRAYLEKLGKVELSIQGPDKGTQDEPVELNAKLEAAEPEELKNNVAFHWATSSGASIIGKDDSATFSASKAGKHAIVLQIKHLGRPGTPIIAEANHLIIVAKSEEEPPAREEKEKDNSEQDEADQENHSKPEDKSIQEKAEAAIKVLGTNADAKTSVANGAMQAPSEKRATPSDKSGIGGLIDAIVDQNKKAAKATGIPIEPPAEDSLGDEPDESTKSQTTVPTKKDLVSQSGQLEIAAPASVKCGEPFTVSLRVPEGKKCEVFNWEGPLFELEDAYRAKKHPQTVRMIAVPTYARDPEYPHVDPYIDIVGKCCGLVDRSHLTGSPGSFHVSCDDQVSLNVPVESLLLDTQIPKHWEKKQSNSGFTATKNHSFQDGVRKISQSSRIDLSWSYGKPIGAVYTHHKEPKPIEFAGFKGSGAESHPLFHMAEFSAYLDQNSITGSKNFTGSVGIDDDKYLRLSISINAEVKLAFDVDDVPTGKQMRDFKPWVEKQIDVLLLEAITIGKNAKLIPYGATPPPLPPIHSDPFADQIPEEEELGTFSVGGVPASPMFGTKAGIKLKSDKKIPSSAVAIWSASEPGIEFSPPEGNSTTVTFGRMVPIKIWAQVVDKKEDKTIAETDQISATIVAPSFSIQLSNDAPLVGQDVKATIVANPALPASLAAWYWMSPASSNRLELNDQASEISLKLKDTSPLALKAEARVKYYNDIVGTATASIQAKSYTVKVTAKKRGIPVMVWDPKAKGLVRAKSSIYYTGEQLTLVAKLEGTPKPSAVRWKWTVGDGVTISNSISQTPTVSRSEAGPIAAKVVATDTDKVVLGEGQITLYVVEPPKAPRKAKPSSSSSSASSQVTQSSTSSSSSSSSPSSSSSSSSPSSSSSSYSAQDETSSESSSQTSSTASSHSSKKTVSPDPEEDSAKDRAMDLVKSGRAHEKSGNLKEALADFQKAQEVLNNPRLAQKIEELKQKIAAAEKTEKESKQQTPAPTSTPSDSSFEDSKKAEGQAESNPKVDKATEKAMALVKVAREKEKKFDIAGALADYRAANQVLKNPRLDEKIRKLENMLAESNKATPEASATKQDSSTPPDQPKLTNTKAADPQQGAEHKTKTASGEPNWITISGTRVSNNTQQVITFASLNIENADGIMLYISEASEMTAKGQNDSARVGEVEFYRKDGQKINPHQVLAESNIGYGFSAKQAIDGIRNYQYMSQGAQGWASVAKQPKASTWLDFRFPIETDVNKIVITTAPSRPYQLSSFELRAFAWREMRLSVGSETTQTSSLANSSTAAPKAVKAKPKNAAPKKVQAKRRVAKVPASKPKDAAITAWAGTFRAQENDGHTATTLTMKLNQQGNSIRGTVTARIVVQGKLFGEETSNVNGSISGNSGKLQFNDDNVKITLSKDGNTIRMAPPDQSESLAFKRITKAKKKNTDNKSAMDRVLGLSE